jgi:hypothetical protein
MKLPDGRARWSVRFHRDPIHRGALPGRVDR